MAKFSRKCYEEGHTWKRVSHTNYVQTMWCPQCGKREQFALDVDTSKASAAFGSKGIPGYSSEGYNEGLGKVIKSKRDYDNTVKEQNALPYE